MVQPQYGTFGQDPAQAPSPATDDQSYGLLVQLNKEDSTASRRKRRNGIAGFLSSDACRILTMAAMLSMLLATSLLFYSALGQYSTVIPQPSPPVRRPPQDDVGTSFLDHGARGYLGESFFSAEVPYIDIPDPVIEDVYYYRWASLQHNLRYTTQGTGYMTTEFVQPVWYAQAFGTINAAAGHQLDESKWLRSQHYGDDYFQIYMRGPANSTQYTEWISHVAERRALLTGDIGFFSSHLDDMVRAFHEWDKVYDRHVGLYYYQPVWDAQELSLPGFIVDPHNTNWDLRKDGPDTYRPSHNAYMVGNAKAIARAASFAGRTSVEADFTKIANSLETAMYKHLWAPEQKFFMDVIRMNNPNLTRLTGREQVGLFPFRFGIGLDKAYAQPAVDAMFDPKGFLTEFGPPTLEVRDPWYMAERPSGYSCYWNGQSWPFSTGHTLKSLAAIYRSGVTNVTAEQYFHYLKTYAITQHKDGKPYVAESHYPERNAWSADGFNHSEHYAHSTNNDDVLSGLLGILPQANDSLVIDPIVPRNWTYFGVENVAYHGHLVSIMYDQEGSRYGLGRGLTVFVNGVKVHHGDSMKAVVPIPSPVFPEKRRVPVNIAANPNGLGSYPLAEASYTYKLDWAYKAIDGVLYYDQTPDNRWTNFKSPNKNDTLTITFPRWRNVSSVNLAIYSDAVRGGSIDVPASIEIYGSKGLLTKVDGATLFPNDLNEINFGETETTFLSINMHAQKHKYVGLCEVEVWVPPSGPTYYAVDALISGHSTTIQQDNSTVGVTQRSVVAGLGQDSMVAFSGVLSDAGGPSTLTFVYSNPGMSTVQVSLDVNQMRQPGGVLLAPTKKGTYGQVEVSVTLAVGKNFVSLIGGSGVVMLETMTVS